MGNVERFLREHNRLSALNDPISRMIRSRSPDQFWAPADRYWSQLSDDERDYVRRRYRLAERYLPPRENSGSRDILQYARFFL